MDRRVFEETLLCNLRSRQSELTAFLADCSSHWGFEDPIYRFYHQSVKVYALRDETARIVRTLESLAPDRPLNPWFRQIVEQGTGKSASSRPSRWEKAAISVEASSQAPPIDARGRQRL